LKSPKSVENPQVEARTNKLITNLPRIFSSSNTPNNPKQMETNRRATNHLTNPKPSQNNAPTTEIDRPSFPQPVALHLDYITQSQVSGRHILEL